MHTRSLITLFALLALSRLASAGDYFEVDGLALRGYDPVAYFELGKPTRGLAQFSATHKGSKFLVASAKNQAAFAAEPEKYAPQFGGFCALGTANGYKVATEPDAFKVVDGKLYLYGGARSRQGWMLDYVDNIRSGDMYWETETKDMPYRLQNAKRYTFKVPGYKTDAELDALYAQRKAAGTLNPLAAKYGS